MAATRFLIVFALSLLLFSQETKAQGNGAVLLYNNVHGNNQLNTRGIVKVYYNGRWGTICSISSDYGFIPDVVCHQLGYTGGSRDDSYFGTSAGQAVLQDVYCSTTNYLVILQCLYVPTTFCDSSVQIACYSTRIWDSPYTGMVRILDNGRDGIVQVYCGGWGAICDDSTFNYNAAGTICTQLGYTSASAISSIDNYYGRILYGDLSCPAVEDCLHDCASCPVSDATCSTDAVVSVICSHDGSDSEGSQQYTCRTDSDNGSGLSTGVIVIIVTTSLSSIAFCLSVVIPACALCYLGICKGTRRTKVYSTI